MSLFWRSFNVLLLSPCIEDPDWQCSCVARIRDELRGVDDDDVNKDDDNAKGNTDNADDVLFGTGYIKQAYSTLSIKMGQGDRGCTMGYDTL